MDDPYAPLSDAEVQAMKIITHATADNLPDSVLFERLQQLAKYYKDNEQEGGYFSVLRVVGYLKLIH